MFKIPRAALLQPVWSGKVKVGSREPFSALKGVPVCRVLNQSTTGNSQHCYMKAFPEGTPSRSLYFPPLAAVLCHLLTLEHSWRSLFCFSCFFIVNISKHIGNWKEQHSDHHLPVTQIQQFLTISWPSLLRICVCFAEPFEINLQTSWHLPRKTLTHLMSSP